jgi:hypothetical protein
MVRASSVGSASFTSMIHIRHSEAHLAIRSFVRRVARHTCFVDSWMRRGRSAPSIEHARGGSLEFVCWKLLECSRFCSYACLQDPHDSTSPRARPQLIVAQTFTAQHNSTSFSICPTDGLARLLTA